MARRPATFEDYPRKSAATGAGGGRDPLSITQVIEIKEPKSGEGTGLTAPAGAGKAPQDGGGNQERP